MYKILLDLLFPIPSLDGDEGQWINEEEWNVLSNLSSLYLTKSDLQHMQCDDLDAVIAVADYQASPLLKKAIRTLKYKRIPALSHTLGMLMTAAIHNTMVLNTATPITLCPVPLHWTRQFQRGFNQATLLANVVSKEMHWPAVPLLTRIRPTGHQARRKRDERLHAVKQAFKVKPNRNIPNTVILVDDLITTGATMQACAKELKKAGAKRVLGLVLARG